MRWIIVVTLLCCGMTAGATRAEDPSPATGMSPEALDILAEDLPAGSHADLDACISTRSVRRIDVLDSAHILFTSRREAWLNRLALNCRGLRPGQLPEFSRYGSRLCRHDTLLARERGIAVGDDFPPRCRLGSFEKLDLQQAAMLREQFRQLRLLRRHASPAEPAGSESEGE